jgi:peptidoglycan hydrolase CwlO-like protein
VDLLRAETVTCVQLASTRKAELEGARRQFASERAALNHELERQRSEIESQGDELERQRDAIHEQTEKLHQLFAEIERLNGIIEEMEGTKAWRLHRLAERLRGR